MPFQDKEASFIQTQHLFLRKCWIETIKVEWESVNQSETAYIKWIILNVEGLATLNTMILTQVDSY